VAQQSLVLLARVARPIASCGTPPANPKGGRVVHKQLQDAAHDGFPRSIQLPIIDNGEARSIAPRIIGAAPPLPAALQRFRQSHGAVLDPGGQSGEHIDAGNLPEAGDRNGLPVSAWGIGDEMGARLPASRVVDGLEDVGRHENPAVEAPEGQSLEDRAGHDIGLAALPDEIANRALDGLPGAAVKRRRLGDDVGEAEGLLLTVWFRPPA
jgi:hypothetical protein